MRHYAADVMGRKYVKLEDERKGVLRDEWGKNSSLKEMLRHLE